MPEFGQSSFEQKKEVKVTAEKMGEMIEALHEEYAVFALDRELQMTEVEYLKMMDIKNRIPDLDECEQETLGGELILNASLLSDIVNTSLSEMEEYFKTHGDQWRDMTS